MHASPYVRRASETCKLGKPSLQEGQGRLQKIREKAWKVDARLQQPAKVGGTVSKTLEASACKVFNETPQSVQNLPVPKVFNKMPQ